MKNYKFVLFRKSDIRLIIYFILTVIFIYWIALPFNINVNKIKKDNTVVFWTLQLSSFDKYINNIIGQFSSNTNNVWINWIDIPYSEGEKRTLASVLTDNPPDLVNITPDFSMLLAQKSALQEIPDEKLSNYNLKEALMHDEKYYGIPFYATSAVTLFNKSLMPDLKQMPKTYEELLNIEPPKGAYTTMISFSENDTLLKILNKYNINSPQTINSEKSVYLFNMFKNAYDKKYIPVESVTQTHRDALEKYMSGQLVFLVTGANFINMIKENAPDIYKNTVVLPQITGETGKYDYSLMNFIIPVKAKNKEKALEFALLFTNAENQLEFSKMTTVLPVNKQALNDNYFKNSEDNDIQAKARIISANQLNNVQEPLKNIKNKKELNTISSNYVQEILINNAPIKETLDKFAHDWEKL